MWQPLTVIRYIFQELATGGDLFSYLDSRGGGGLCDAECSLIIRQVLEAVKYLHANNVVHRDIKPENILMTSWRAGGRIVLTDFGHAKRFTTSSRRQSEPITRLRMTTYIGTRDYLAPEVDSVDLKADGYSASIDLWSVGAVAAMILTGEVMTPTLKKCNGLRVVYDLSLLENAATNNLWNRIPKRPKDLIRQLLAVNPDDRPSASGALLHSWFTQSTYREYMDVLYKKAISEWTPPPPAKLEVFDTHDMGLSPLEDEGMLNKHVNPWHDTPE